MKSKTLQVRNTLFGTTPLVIHAHGSHDHKPAWLPIKQAFFDLPARSVPANSEVTVITCNNGHQSMGLLERSAEHLGISYRVYGQGIHPWQNARDKPPVLFEALQEIDTPYVLYADSRDAILIDDPAKAVRRFREQFQVRLLFGADRINWPPIRSFQLYENKLAEGETSEFKYINGGAWIGETAFCREFFKKAMETGPAAQAPESEQGILKKLLPQFEGEVAMDYRCRIIQNIGFVTQPIFDLQIQEEEIFEEI